MHLNFVRVSGIFIQWADLQFSNKSIKKMNKTCFIIMPITDYDPYPSGHFKRVYEHIIKPSVIRAGFQPIRADDVLNTNYIAIDIIKHIINSDMAICDLSARIPNVFYELGIRQAFNLPVTLIKDKITARAFDIQGFRDIEYDESLRIDNVELSILTISETLSNTYNNKDSEVNSLISVLGIQAAKVTGNIEISKDTEIILNNLSDIALRINKIEDSFTIPKPNFTNLLVDISNGSWNSDVGELQIGDIVRHPKFGIGEIIKMETKSTDNKATINFQNFGLKTLLLSFSKLEKFIKNTIS